MYDDEQEYEQEYDQAYPQEYADSYNNFEDPDIYSGTTASIVANAPVPITTPPPIPPGDSVSATTSSSPDDFTDSELDAADRDVIPGLIPKYSLNFVIGAPKTGRLRFILPQFNNYASGLPFLEVGISPPLIQLAMVCCTKPVRSIRAKINAMDLRALKNSKTFPIVQWNNAQAKAIWPECPLGPSLKEIHDILDTHQGARETKGKQSTAPTRSSNPSCTPSPRRPHLFILVEDFQRLLVQGHQNDQRSIAELYSTLQKWCADENCTLLGTVGVNKAKPGEGYEHLTHRISGHGQWAEGTECLMLLERERHSTVRKLSIMASYYTQPVLYADFGEWGRLNLCPKPPKAQTAAQTSLDQRLDNDDPGTQYTRIELLSWGEPLGVGTRTVDKWIAHCIESGALHRKSAAGVTFYLKPLEN